MLITLVLSVPKMSYSACHSNKQCPIVDNCSIMDKLPFFLVILSTNVSNLIVKMLGNSWEMSLLSIISKLRLMCPKMATDDKPL